MQFRTRNPYYLRISEKNVLPLYVYLDERHVNWMSDTILQLVLADLQPKILPKLKAEADSHDSSAPANKKATVDTHRGDSYQFCYFIRKTEPHSVLIKTRHFSAAPPQRRPEMPPPPPPAQSSKRKGRKPSRTNSPPNKRRKTKGKGRADEDEDEDESDDAVSSGADEDAGEPDAEPSSVRRSQRSKKVVAGGYQQNDESSPDSDVEMEHADDQASVPVKEEVTEPRLSPTPGPTDAGGQAAPIDIDIDEEEEKPKPVLGLRYQDFNIYGQCLCIVVEPYPPLRSATRAPSLAPVFASSRAQSAAPPGNMPLSLRARTPLFLPDDDDDRERSVTPAPMLPPRTLPRVPLFNEEDDQDSDDGGMMALSQVMQGYSHLPVGAVDDDEAEDEGAIFFGDADEVREM